MRGEEICRIVEGRLLGTPSAVKAFQFDSRQVAQGELFIPLKGRRDGHAFIPDAFKRGAVGALTEFGGAPPKGKFLIKVKDTLEAFKKIASHKRGLFRGTVVGVTGSVGKSTTKELLHHLFSPFLKTYRNLKSFNNEIGLTYTLSNLPLDSSLYIQEVGTNSPGEIALLRELLKPQIAVITAVAVAHAQGLKNLESIREEKLSLTEGADVALLPHDLKNYSRASRALTFGFKEGDVHLSYLNPSPFGSEFSVKAFGSELHFKTPIPGRSVVNATLIAVALAHLLSLPLKELPELLASYTPPEGRLRVESYGSTVLIDDSYNANPASVKNALEVLSLFSGQRVAVLGQMLELGELSAQEHRKVGELLNSLGIDVLVAYGPDTYEAYRVFKGEKFYFEEREELLSFFKELPLDGKAILVKGSRGNRLEEVSQILRERLKS